MDMIEGGMQAASPNDYLSALTGLILGLFGLGMVCRIIFLVLQAMVDGKNIGEILQLVKRRLIVIGMVASVSGIIYVVRAAFE